jgi:hypothetical protein
MQVRVLICVPSPQVTLQSLQLVQSFQLGTKKFIFILTLLKESSIMLKIANSSFILFFQFPFSTCFQISFIGTEGLDLFGNDLDQESQPQSLSLSQSLFQSLQSRHSQSCLVLTVETLRPKLYPLPD